MRPTEILSDEHRVIEQVLACLERIAEEAETRTLDVAAARDVVTFVQNFADRCHHGKEEQRLFPAMERFGLPRDAGPTAVMRAEHESGRRAVRAMAVQIDDAERGDATAARRFANEARGFVEFLREHIAKEDQVLFPMADRMLPEAAQMELLESFAAIENEDMGAGAHERFLDIANRLAERYGVTRADATAKQHTCSCSHGA